MDELLFDDENTEEAKARRRVLRALFRKSLWTLLVLSAFSGLLLPLTVYLNWWKSALFCMLGLLTGISIAYGSASSQLGRALITTLLGALTLPGIAVYLSHMASNSPESFGTASAVITPFVIYALAGLAGGGSILFIWRARADRSRAQAEDPDMAGSPAETRTGAAPEAPVRSMRHD